MLAQVDAVLGLPDGRVYAFAGEQVWRYDLGRDGPARGYPRPITDEFPGAFPSTISAAFISPDGTVTFFCGNQHLRYNLQGRHRLPGFPRPYEPEWRGIPPGGVDAVVRWSPDVVYVFKGDRYWSFPAEGGAARAGYPKPIAGNWPTLGAGPVRALLVLPDDRRIISAGGALHVVDHEGERAVDQEIPAQLAPGAEGAVPVLVFRSRQFRFSPALAELTEIAAGRLRLGRRGDPQTPAPIRSTGGAIREVQRALTVLGYALPRFGVDGRFGNETYAAVLSYKRTYNIRTASGYLDGVVGPKTIRHLDAALAAREPKPRACPVRAPATVGAGSPVPGCRVAVVGGGFSGLAAAWSLNDGGFPVTLFEATDALGGRVRTDKALIPGKVVEAGAELIGLNHPTWIRLAKTFGLQRTRLTTKEQYENRNLKVQLRLGSQDFTKAQRKALEGRLVPILNKIGAEARPISPVQPWAFPGAASLDARSVADRFNDPDMFGPSSSPERHFLEFILENDQCAPVGRQSYLGLLTAVSAHRMGNNMLGYWESTETHRCAGGNQQLAAMLAACLPDVRLARPVVGIEIDPSGVNVGFTDGFATRVERFTFVVLATPPTTWPPVQSTPPFVPTNFSVAQGPAVKFVSVFDKQFWLPQRLAPSALWDQLGSVWETTDRQPVSKPGFGLTVYSGGGLAQSAASYQAKLPTLFPGYASQLKRSQLFDWTAEPFIRTGNAIPAVGQVTTVVRNLSRPFNRRLFFAGEQASPGFFGYMEGALQSGIRAAQQVAVACIRPDRAVAKEQVA